MSAQHKPGRKRRLTKDERLKMLFDALVSISAQTKDYDEFSTMGALHAIAHRAVLAEGEARAAIVKPTGSAS